MEIQTAEAYLRTKAAEKFIKDIERLIAKGVNVLTFTEKYKNE